MKGLKKHSHEDRAKVIQEIAPWVKQKFGSSLVALAAQASYARDEDSDYSDLELIAFVREMPEGKTFDGIGRIRDGLLVELVWTTREAYISEVKEVTDNWYIAGSDRLLPIINEELVVELNNYTVENLKKKCLKQAVRHWHEVQESTAKVLNAIEQDNREGLLLVAWDMIRHMLICLSFLNQTPYITFSRFITQARSFSVQPAGFGELADLFVEGGYQDYPLLAQLIHRVFEGFEEIFQKEGCELYDSDLGPI